MGTIFYRYEFINKINQLMCKKTMIKKGINDFEIWDDEITFARIRFGT